MAAARRRGGRSGRATRAEERDRGAARAPGRAAKAAGRGEEARGARSAPQSVNRSLGRSAVTHPCGGWGGGERSRSGTPPPPVAAGLSRPLARRDRPFHSGQGTLRCAAAAAERKHARTHARADARTHGTHGALGLRRRDAATLRGGARLAREEARREHAGFLRVRAVARLPLPLPGTAPPQPAPPRGPEPREPGNGRGSGGRALRVRSSHRRPLEAEVGGESGLPAPRRRGARWARGKRRARAQRRGGRELRCGSALTVGACAERAFLSLQCFLVLSVDSSGRMTT